MTQPDPVLAKFRAAVRELYGARIERLVLFGSRARGDANRDSDYDVALFLEEMTSRWHDGLELAEIELNLLEDSGASVHTLLFPAGAWRDPTSRLMEQIRGHGIEL